MTSYTAGPTGHPCLLIRCARTPGATARRSPRSRRRAGTDGLALSVTHVEHQPAVACVRRSEQPAVLESERRGLRERTRRAGGAVAGRPASVHLVAAAQGLR